MQLVIQQTEYRNSAITFTEKIKNNILDSGYFYRLYYSDEYFTTNGLFVAFTLRNATIEKYFNKIKCSFKAAENKAAISFIRDVERDILKPFTKCGNKRCSLRIDEQLKHNFIKVFWRYTYTRSFNIQHFLCDFYSFWDFCF